jgi:hypothetical protein
MAVELALSANEWAAKRIERGEEFQGDGIRASVDPVLGFIVDNFTPETQSSHDDPRSLASIIALANDALPNSDRRKITRTWVNWLREEADVLKRGGAGAGALMATEIADALQSYLPPE